MLRSEIAALVLGARGAHGGPRPAGHTALEVLTRASKPFVVVPPLTQPPARLARILVPLDGSRDSSRALEDMIKLAHRSRARPSPCMSTRLPRCRHSPITSHTPVWRGTRSSSPPLGEASRPREASAPAACGDRRICARSEDQRRALYEARVTTDCFWLGALPRGPMRTIADSVLACAAYLPHRDVVKITGADHVDAFPR
jgi:hypothetical protein